MANGLFIVLDGPDGCGKSTQARRLVERLIAAGKDALHLRDPGGTPAGEKIRALLLDPAERVSTPAEVFLFMASRAELVEQVLGPALRDGKIVVCERWVSSTIAYQGVAGGFGPADVVHLGKLATGGLAPDALFLLDVEPKTGLGRVRRRFDRMEKKGPEYHEAVRRAFLALKEFFPKMTVIDASKSEEDVAADLWREVQKCL